MSERTAKKSWLPRAEQLPLISTIAVCALMYLLACWRYENFFNLRQTISFFKDNIPVGIVAIGVTFVILSGGIDLSVGAAIGFVSIAYARLILDFNFDVIYAAPLLVLITSLVGAGMGAVIHYFKVPPFLITLSGMFAYRGAALVVSTASLNTSGYFGPINEYTTWVVRAGGGRGLPPVDVGLPLVIFLLLVVFAFGVLNWTTYGRSLFAIGGNEQSALLMGLPVARNKILTYAFSGFCAGVAGLTFVFLGVGSALKGGGYELEAITVVVIGGTLLTGGYGSIVGTVFGLLIYAIINEVATSRANLPSAWLRIFIGGLLLAFILLQKALQFTRRGNTA